MPHEAYQDAEKVRQRRSRIAQRLNVPKRTPRLFAHCGLAGGLFEHPEAMLTSATFCKIPTRYCVYAEFFLSLLGSGARVGKLGRSVK